MRLEITSLSKATVIRMLISAFPSGRNGKSMLFIFAHLTVSTELLYMHDFFPNVQKELVNSLSSLGSAGIEGLNPQRLYNLSSTPPFLY